MTIINVDMTETDYAFEKLGYERAFHQYALVYSKKDPYPQQIEFMYDNKTVCAECYVRNYWRALELNKEEIDLIKQKIIELNW